MADKTIWTEKSDCTFSFEVYTLDSEECHDKCICVGNKTYTYEEYMNGTLLNDAKDMTTKAMKAEFENSVIEINIWNIENQYWEEEIEYWTLFE